MTSEQAAENEKRALFRAVAFFVCDLKPGMTSLLITVSMSQVSENFKLLARGRSGEKASHCGAYSSPACRIALTNRGSAKSLGRITPVADL